MKPNKKSKKLRAKRKFSSSLSRPILTEATCTATFTAYLDVVTSYSAGVSGYYKLLLASDFTGLNAFQALFFYYTPKRAQASFTLRTAADNGLLVRFRPLDPVIDSGFSSAITEPVQMASDPTTIQCISNDVNQTPVIPYKNRKVRFTTSAATSDKLGAIWLTFPVAQDASGTATSVITVHTVFTFYRKASQAAGS